MVAVPQQAFDLMIVHELIQYWENPDDLIAWQHNFNNNKIERWLHDGIDLEIQDLLDGMTHGMWSFMADGGMLVEAEP